MKKAANVLAGTHFLSGNEALAEGAIVAGCRFFAGYPITPSTEIAEHMARRMPQVGGIYVQMEDEIASIGAVIGAAWGGAKAMTATSGPGFSLMQEYIGFAVMTETPCVIVDVQRGSPSTGLPTKVGQGDVMQAKWGSHGHYEIIALAPNSPQEMFNMAIKAFNFAEHYRVPIFILADECVAHIWEKVVIPKVEEIEVIDRKRPERGEEYLPYKPDEDMIPPMAIAGEGFRFHITGLTHDERGYPAITGKAQDRLVRRLCDKIRKNVDKIAEVERVMMEDAEVAVISYGAPSRCCLPAIEIARKKGVKAGLIRLKTLWPFPERVIREAANQVKAFVVAEINYGQVALEVERCAGGKAKILLAEKLGGKVHTPQEILQKILKVK